MTRLAAAGFALAAAATLGTVVTAPTSAPAAADTIALHDDFNGTGLPDPNRYLLTTGTAYPGGPAAFGTNEIQTYTSDLANVKQRNGSLEIRAIRDANGQWTSARVETKAAFKPAPGQVMRVEARIAMPDVHGISAYGYWPAFWMMGNNYRSDRWSWPAIGEFDIMESVSGVNGSNAVLHCGYKAQWGGPCNEPSGKNIGLVPCPGSDCWGNFHSYRFEWDRTTADDTIRWFVDGQHRQTIKLSTLPADVRGSMLANGYFALMNLAIDGAYPSAQGKLSSKATLSGHAMRVDSLDIRYVGTGTPGTTAPKPTTTAPVTTAPKPTTSVPAPSSSSAPTSTPAGRLGLTIIEIGRDHITFKWNGTAGATYDILRAGIKIDTVKGTQYTDINLNPNTPYILAVQGPEGRSPDVTVTTRP